jgi:hypothetical protein
MIKLNTMDNILFAPASQPLTLYNCVFCALSKAPSCNNLSMYDAQRQGRISFYMTNYGEEATHIGRWRRPCSGAAPARARRNSCAAHLL